MQGKWKFQPNVILFIALIFLVMDSPGVSAKKQPLIAVVRSRQIAPYEQAIAGFKNHLKQSGQTVKYQSFNMPRDEKNIHDFVQKIQQEHPDLILVVGTEAAVLLDQQVKQIPIVFNMVLDPVESGIVADNASNGKNITGVSLQIKIKDQFRVLKDLMPELGTIGMLYDQNKKTALYEEANTVAREMNLTLLGHPITKKSEVDHQMRKVLHDAECLWAMVDTLIYNPKTAKQILLTTFRTKKPFMAFSSHYVKAGALLALECDYYDIGEQSGEMAAKILSGQDVKKMTVEFPRRWKLLINLNTADVIGLRIPKAFLKQYEKELVILKN